MSKRFKSGRELCVYCCKQPGFKRDHIVARKFFLVSARGNLPTAPCCQPCNTEKSKLEQYLMVVLPFGYRHPDALETLETLVPGRLRNNRKLHAYLKANSTGQNIPFDGASMEKLFKLIVRGLMWHHWKLYINNETHSIRYSLLNANVAFTRSFEEAFMRCPTREHVSEVVGNGAFCYEGKQEIDDPTRSIWRFSIFGDLVFGEGANSEPMPTRVVVMTGPKEAMDR